MFFAFPEMKIIGKYVSIAKKYDKNGPTMGVPPVFKPKRIRGAEDPKESPAPNPHNNPFRKSCCLTGSLKLIRGLKIVITKTPDKIKPAPSAEMIFGRSFKKRVPKTIA